MISRALVVCICVYSGFTSFVSPAFAAEPGQPKFRLLKGGETSKCEVYLNPRELNAIPRVIAQSKVDAFEEIVKKLKVFRRSVALSSDGEFFVTVFDEGPIEVRRTHDGSLYHSLPLDLIRFKSDHVISISPDGHQIALVRAFDEEGRRVYESSVLDLRTRREVFASRGNSPILKLSETQLGRTASTPPMISFFEGGFVALETHAALVYDFRGRLLRSVPLAQAGVVEELGWVSSNVARHAYFEPKSKTLFVFYSGPPPVAFGPRTTKIIFEDGRTENAHSTPTEGMNLLEMLRAYQYQDMSSIGFSPNGNYLSQGRSFGSGYDYSYQAFIDVFTSKGKLLGTVRPPYTAALSFAAFSQNEERVAFAMQKSDPMASLEIWIFSLSDLSKPVQVLRDLKLLTIDSMVFTANGSLVVASNNSGRCVVFDPQ